MSAGVYPFTINVSMSPCPFITVYNQEPFALGACAWLSELVCHAYQWLS